MVCALFHFNAFECAHSFECAYSHLIIPLWLSLCICCCMRATKLDMDCVPTAWLEEVDCYVYAYQIIKYIPHSTYRYCTTTDVPQISHIHPVSIVVVCIPLLNLRYCWIFGLRIPLLIGSWLLCNTPICIDTDHTTDVPPSQLILNI